MLGHELGDREGHGKQDKWEECVFTYAQDDFCASLPYSRICEETSEKVTQHHSGYGSDKVFNPNLHGIKRYIIIIR